MARLGRTPVLGMYGTRDSQFPPDMLRGFEVRRGSGQWWCCAPARGSVHSALRGSHRVLHAKRSVWV